MVNESRWDHPWKILLEVNRMVSRVNWLLRLTSVDSTFLNSTVRTDTYYCKAGHKVRANAREVSQRGGAPILNTRMGIPPGGDVTLRQLPPRRMWYDFFIITMHPSKVIRRLNNLTKDLIATLQSLAEIRNRVDGLMDLWSAYHKLAPSAEQHQLKKHT